RLALDRNGPRRGDGVAGRARPGTPLDRRHRPADRRARRRFHRAPAAHPVLPRRRRTTLETKKPGLAFAYFRALCLNLRRRRNETPAAGYRLPADHAVHYFAL